MIEEKYQIPSKIPIDGDKIKKRREELGLTQLYVASIVGVTTDTISRWENKKYPTIKKENALKLANALEIDISELIREKEIITKTTEEEEVEKPISEKNNNKKEKRYRRSWDIRSFINKKLYFVIMLITILFVAVVFYGVNYYKQQSLPNIKIQRILPNYVAPGEKFPVIITIKIQGSNTSSLILREHFPHSCTFIQSIPHYVMKKLKENELIWIFPPNKKDFVVVYFLKTKNNISIGTQLKFTGSITMQKGKYKQSIRGDKNITIKYVHWADLNGDLKIDDQEILTIFDELQGIKGINYGKREIERLWAAGKYHWDDKKHKFLPNK